MTTHNAFELRRMAAAASIAAFAAFAVFATGCATQRVAYREVEPAYTPAYVPVPAYSVREPAYAPVPPVASAPRSQYGQVQSIDVLRAAPATSGGGAVIGGVVGALIGHQMGHGMEKAVATTIGVVGGAVIGNEIEKDQSRGREAGAGYRVVVRFEGGGQRAFNYAQLNDLRIGDRVRVDGNQLYRN